MEVAKTRMIPIIFQAYRTISDVNGTGIQGVFQTASEAVPVLPALILAGLFIVLAFGSFFSTQRRKGIGDLPASFSAAGFVCVVVAVLMSLIPNFITNETIVPAIVLEIMFVVWLFFSRE